MSSPGGVSLSPAPLIFRPEVSLYARNASSSFFAISLTSNHLIHHVGLRG